MSKREKERRRKERRRQEQAQVTQAEQLVTAMLAKHDGTSRATPGFPCGAPSFWPKEFIERWEPPIGREHALKAGATFDMARLVGVKPAERTPRVIFGDKHAEAMREARA